jgi:prephenate dehydrogenase
MDLKAVIVGGSGEMGGWFFKFLAEQGITVTISGRSAPVTYSEYDIVMISVPIDVTCEVISDVAPKLRPGSLLFDIASIKAKPALAMRKFAPSGVELVGVHPLFGSSMPNMEGQTIIMTPIRGQKWFDFLMELFTEAGAHVEILTPEEHDKVMSIIQGLTHFAYIATGVTLDSLRFDIKNSRKYMSPIYEILIDFVGRILGQNPKLYASIQMNADRSVHDEFLKQSHELVQIIKKNDMEAFIAKMKHAARHFGDAEPALKRSDKLIMSRIKELEELKEAIGSIRGVRHVYTGAVHVGTIKSVSSREVVVQEKRQEVVLKTENIQLMSDEELRAYRLSLGQIFRDFSVILPRGADPNTVADVIAHVRDVTGSEIIDVYKDLHSVTFRIFTFTDGDALSLQRSVESLLRGIGCIMR